MSDATPTAHPPPDSGGAASQPMGDGRPPTVADTDRSDRHKPVGPRAVTVDDVELRAAVDAAFGPHSFSHILDAARTATIQRVRAVRLVVALCGFELAPSTTPNPSLMPPRCPRCDAIAAARQDRR